LLAIVQGQPGAKPFCATATVQPGRSGTGQLQNKLGGAVGSAMPGDAAGVEFGNSPDLGQTQTATATRLPTRKERIEEMFLPGRVWSGAIVFDDYLDLVGIERLDATANSTTLRRCFESVTQQAFDGGLQKRTVRNHRNRLVWAGAAQCDLLLLGFANEPANDLAKQSVQPQATLFGFRRASEKHQV
jgi:hypothetical protein